MIIVLYLIVSRSVCGQECTSAITVGSSDHDSKKTTDAGYTYILAGYTIPCDGIVTAWKFCSQKTSVATPVTFYPGIWRKNGTGYFLVRSNNVTVTYNPKEGKCQTFNVPVPDQLSASVESVVGLYIDKGQSSSQLLLSKKGESPTTYKIKNNRSNIVNETPIKVNISFEAHIGKTMYMHGYMYISNNPDLFFISARMYFHCRTKI